MKRVPRRVFTAEYKSEAIRLAEAVGVPTAARQLDIDTKSLHLWIRQAKAGELKPSRPAKLTAEQQRIRELERELAIARIERDLLKKAAAFFGKTGNFDRVATTRLSITKGAPIPGALSFQEAANSTRQPFLFKTDSSFQLTGLAISHRYSRRDPLDCTYHPPD